MNEQLVFTNRLDYQFNPIALQRDFTLLRLSVPKDQMQAYLDLREAVTPQAVVVFKTDEQQRTYLWLIKASVKLANTSIPIETILFHRLAAAHIGQHQLLQLLLNRHTIVPVLGPVPNALPKLLLFDENSFQNQQCVTLSAEITRDNEFVMRVKTYTQTTKPLAFEDVQVDWQRQRLTPSGGQADSVRYRFGNHTHERNVVTFASLDSPKALAASKVHFAWTLLQKLQTFDDNYFRQLPTFVQTPLMLPWQPILPAKSSIWEFFANAEIWVVYQEADPLSKALAERIAEVINQSAALQQLMIHATTTINFQQGYHIQVVHALEVIQKAAMRDPYQLTTPTQWIQHVTIENFWSQKLALTATGELTWRKSMPDALNDPSLVKVAQDLVVKHDLQREKLHPLPDETFAAASACECVTFSKADQPHHVACYRMMTMPDGQIQMSQRLIDLAHLTVDNRDGQLCQQLIQKLNTRDWSVWQWIDYVMCWQQDILIVMQTQMLVMPNEPAMQALLKGGDPDQEIDRHMLLDALKQLKSKPDQSSEYHEMLNQFIEDMALLPRGVWSLKQLKAYLKGLKSAKAQAKYKLTFKKPIHHVICADLFALCGVNFTASVRRKADRGNVTGLQGMGLLVIDGQYHYFVGSNQPLNTAVDKAVRLRKLLPLATNRLAVASHYEQLRQLMAVEFVASGRYTVRPFQVKYLREYQDQQIRLRKTGKPQPQASE